MVFNTGCCDKRVVIQEVEVLVPVAKGCKQVSCDAVLGMNNVEVLTSLLKCNKDRELALKACK